MKRIPTVVSRMARDGNFFLPASKYNGPDHPNAVKELRALLRVARVAKNWTSDLRSIDAYASDEAKLRSAVSALEKVRSYK